MSSPNQTIGGRESKAQRSRGALLSTVGALTRPTMLGGEAQASQLNMGLRIRVSLDHSYSRGGGGGSLSRASSLPQNLNMNNEGTSLTANIPSPLTNAFPIAKVTPNSVNPSSLLHPTKPSKGEKEEIGDCIGSQTVPISLWTTRRS